MKKEDFPEVIAQEIGALSEAMRKLKSGRLSRRAIVVLIKDRTPGIGIPAINEVLDAAENLALYYLKRVDGLKSSPTNVEGGDRG